MLLIIDGQGVKKDKNKSRFIDLSLNLIFLIDPCIMKSQIW